MQQVLYAFGSAVYQKDPSASSASAPPPPPAKSQATPPAASATTPPAANDPFAFDLGDLDMAQDETVRVDLNPFGDKDGNPFGGNNDEDPTGTADYEAID